LDISKLKNPKGLGTTSDTVRLAVLTVLALIVVAAIIFFNHLSRLQDDEAALNPEEFTSAPAAKRIPGANVEFEKLESVRDDDVASRVIKEKEPYLHLVRQASRLVYGDMDLLGVQKAVPEEILEDTDACRGKPYEIKGNLQWYEKITDLDFELYRGYLTSHDGHYFYFTVRDLDEQIAIGDVVKLQGFFFKRYSFTLSGENERVNDAIFLVGKRLIPSFYEMPPVYGLNMDLLDTLYDFELQDMMREFEEKPLYHMLSFVKNMSDETYKLMAFEEHLARDILKAPGKFRGAPVKVLGEIIWLVERNLGPEGENPVGPKTIYHGVLLNYQGRFCYFLSFERPKEYKKKDLVYINGLFFRNYAYRSQSEQVIPAPVVIVRGFEKFVLPKDNTFLYISYTILAGAALAVAFFFYHIFRDRKQNQQFREKFIARKKRLLHRVMHPAPAAGGEGAPSGAPDPAGSPREPPPDASGT
jgi:hypothetical protein